MSREVRRFQNLEELNCDAAAFFSEWTRRCVAERGTCHLVLSGGSTPEKLYRKLAGPPFDVSVPWSQIHVHLGDERCVPPTHPDSNYRMAHAALLSRFALPPERLHRPPGEVSPPEAGARLWEAELRTLFPGPATEDGFPVFDLILLGMGSDGHTASLFPGHPALEENRHWVAAVTAPAGDPPVPRLTLTLPVINRARCVLFLVSGKGKKRILDQVLSGPGDGGGTLPAARVRPSGSLLWFLDGAYV
jgi:6-phosphogluconolactonase